MAERAQVRLSAVAGYTVLRVKSWLPHIIAGGLPVTLSGAEMPSRVGEVRAGSTRALCIGPAEWLLVSRENAADLRQQLEPGAATFGLSLLELTDALSVLELGGPTAPEVLARGCGLDLHPERFAAGHCTRTRLAQLPVVIDCVDPLPRYTLFVARSYRVWLTDWLADASQD